MKTAKDLVNTEKAVALYFSSDDCSVCKVLKPKVQFMLSDSYPNISQLEVNVSQDKQTAAFFNVFSAPTLLIFFEGNEYFREVRNMSIPDLEQKLQRPYQLLFS